VSFNQLLIDQAQVSLNFAAFPTPSPDGERLGAGPALRLWRDVLHSPSRFWQIDLLYRTRSTSPNGSARFICFRSSADLPRIGIAALRAEAFIVTPAWLQRL
jgi:lysyl-tRNA synthetase, class II